MLAVTLLLPRSGRAQAWAPDVSVKNEPYFAYVGPGNYYTDDIAIQAFQTDLWFSTGNECIFKFEARVVEPYVSDWDVLHEGAGCATAGRWDSAPTTPGAYTIQSRVTPHFSNTNRVLNFQLGVVPAALQGYRRTNADPGDNPDNDKMTLWSGTTDEVDSPLLIVEGIDADNVNSAADYYALAPGLLNTGRFRGADVFVLSFDDVGRRVLESAPRALGEGAQELDLDASRLSPGAYVVRVRADGALHGVSRVTVLR